MPAPVPYSDFNCTHVSSKHRMIYSYSHLVHINIHIRIPANPPSDPSFDWKMYRYIPSLAAGILFISLFTILTLFHIYAYTQSRRTSFIYIILGGLCEIAGFGARIGSYFDNAAWAPFIIQGTLLLVGPLFFAATVYMMLGRAVRCAAAETVSRVGSRWYTRVFVTADVSTLVVQGLGELSI
jgi:hypothetical protein